MLRLEIRICRKCGMPYLWTGGGFVAGAGDFADDGLCKVCRGKRLKERIDKVLRP